MRKVVGSCSKLRAISARSGGKTRRENTQWRERGRDEDRSIQREVNEGSDEERNGKSAE
jgi:hypothetical protein